MISGNWKGPFYVWTLETKQEKEQAKKEITEILKEAELRVARELWAAAVEPGVGEKIKTKQAWQGKKYKIKKLKRMDAKGVDSWRYVTSLYRLLLWPTCLQ
ncbi:hypothetical protein L873DRAFT_1868831 [Choiromyces venosus 120613-1]|uniref:Uncharacterized protein n=1 Tax=Choiromyces venosus 120613-1 TaxID=1336337 RepID=A0A3N4IZE5_9PEZI|nr:hypothetical protein L873DRAFT_1868831 [Choiromyces venosus 120613-1]